MPKFDFTSVPNTVFWGFFFTILTRSVLNAKNWDVKHLTEFDN